MRSYCLFYMIRLLSPQVHWHWAFLVWQAQTTSCCARQKNYGSHMIARVHNIAHVNCWTCTYFFQKQTAYVWCTTGPVTQQYAYNSGPWNFICGFCRKGILGRQHLTAKITFQLLETLLFNQRKIKIVLYYHLIIKQDVWNWNYMEFILCKTWF